MKGVATGGGGDRDGGQGGLGGRGAHSKPRRRGQESLAPWSSPLKKQNPYIPGEGRQRQRAPHGREERRQGAGPQRRRAGGARGGGPAGGESRQSGRAGARFWRGGRRQGLG